MTLKEFKKLEKWLQAMLAKLEQEALDADVDTTTAEFEAGLLEMKKRLLAQKNIPYEAYEEMEKIVNEGKELSESEMVYFPTLAKQMKEKDYEKRKEFEDKAVALKEDFLNKLTSFKTETDYIFKKTKIKNEQDVKNLQDQILRQKKDWSQELGSIARQITALFDGLEKTKKDIPSVDAIKGGLDILEETVASLKKKVDGIKIPKVPDYKKLKRSLEDYSADHISRKLDIYGMPDWRKLAMGLQGQIDALSASITSESIWDRSGTNITTQVAGDSVTLGGALTATALHVTGNIADGTNTLTVANAKAAYDHSQDNTQAHSDYLLNSGNDTTSGELTASAFKTTGEIHVGDHGAASAYCVLNAIYGTAATSPVAASTTPIGTIYIQYTA